jgi:hypothetical protein
MRDDVGSISVITQDIFLFFLYINIKNNF